MRGNEMTIEQDIDRGKVDLAHQMPAKQDFIAVALAARQRGFAWIVPVAR
jgi:hypothetical protein